MYLRKSTILLSEIEMMPFLLPRLTEIPGSPYCRNRTRGFSMGHMLSFQGCGEGTRMSSPLPPFVNSAVMDENRACLPPKETARSVRLGCDLLRCPGFYNRKNTSVGLGQWLSGIEKGELETNVGSAHPSPT